MSNEIYKRYRPKNLSQLIGQPEAVQMLEGMIKNNAIPHATLLCGPSGVGKTTTARILKKLLKCNDNDFEEINAADTRGLDTIRQIRSMMNLSPSGGQCRIYLLDECFHGDTIVNINGVDTPIREVREGDVTENINGITTVERVFKNKVAVDRVVRIVFDDGAVIFCSEDHKFLTNNGWKAAGSLTTSDTFGKLVGKETHHATSRSNVSVLQENVSRSSLREEEILQSILSGEGQNHPTGDKRKAVRTGDAEENQRIPHKIPQNKEGVSRCQKIVGKNEGRQSYEGLGHGEKNDGCEREQRNASRLEGETRRERAIHTATDRCMGSVGRGCHRMDHGSSDTNRTQSAERIGISNLLQSGHREQETETGDRDRWGGASSEEKYVKRCQENPEVVQVRVDNVEVYQSGSNDDAFRCAISDQDRDRGYVEFYDLQINGHPSYFANGIPVHNCHNLTKREGGDAQTALLKLLEDTPDHVYFILATTDPQGLRATIRTRCTEIRFNPLSPKAMAELITSIAEKEGTTLSEEVIDKLVESAEGSARKALVLLDSVIKIEDAEEQLNCIASSTAKQDAFLIVKALLWEKADWPAVAKMIKEITTDDWEGLRHLILVNATNELLKAGKSSPRAYAVVRCFDTNWFDSKRAGLAAACYEVLTQK